MIKKFVIHKLPNYAVPSNRFITECTVWPLKQGNSELRSTTRWSRVTCKRCLKSRSACTYA